MSYNKIKNYDIKHEIFGKGIPVITIHGYPLDRNFMKSFLEPVFRDFKNFKRIYFDLPGMGETKAEPWIKNIDIMDEIVSEFIKKHIGNKKFILIGESYGGYLARGLLKKFRSSVEGISLICPVVDPNFKNRSLPKHKIKIIDNNFINKLTDSKKNAFISTNTIITEKTWLKYKNIIVKSLEKCDKTFIKNFQDTGYSYSYEIDNIKFNKPVLILTGLQDSTTGYKDSFKLLDNYSSATFITLDGAGHNLQFEQEELFNYHMKNWLKSIK